MDLMQFDGCGTVVRLSTGDCAELARIAGVAEEHLISVEDQPLNDAALRWAALFRALAFGNVTLGWILGPDQVKAGEDLAALGIGGLLPESPHPGGSGID